MIFVVPLLSPMYNQNNEEMFVILVALIIGSSDELIGVRTTPRTGSEHLIHWVISEWMEE